VSTLNIVICGPFQDENDEVGVQNSHAPTLIRSDDGGGSVCNNQSIGVAEQLTKLTGFGG